MNIGEYSGAENFVFSVDENVKFDAADGRSWANSVRARAGSAQDVASQFYEKQITSEYIQTSSNLSGRGMTIGMTSTKQTPRDKRNSFIVNEMVRGAGFEPAAWA